MATILIIDDDPQIIEFLSKLLTGEGYRVLAKQSGQGGLDILKTIIPDAIIVDVMMPMIDGYQFLWHLRSSEATASIPTMMLTSRASKNDIQYGKSLGADMYLAKPPQPEELIGAVKSMTMMLAETRRQAG
ncbi:response regulator [Maritalea mediterranea]|uniref:Response regulator n=1 Tax=Maritalea mediterranea TaxID=2909667 RepID=A0ABS9E4Z0_9HYPH|nr:response regulator [Maritalea mediterranea]MCF4097267.1 response regulator [Maritalea mediterranea]